MRAIAILFVALYHAGLPGLPGGFIGVDIFFVLSGYLITGILVHEIETRGKVDFVAFYARRIRRLLPAAAFVIVATVLAAQFIFPPQELIALTKDAVTTSLYASNLWFAHISTDYLSADAAKSPLLHSWSLSVEEQFYVLWPLFILLALRGIRNTASNPQRLLLAMTLLAAVSFGLCLWLTGVAQPWAFFSSPARAWEFAIGGLASQLPAGWIVARLRVAQLGFFTGLLLIVAAATTYGHGTVFPGVAAVVPVIGTALMLACHIPGANTLQLRLLSLPLMQYLGSRSYSWYLWHWPVLVLVPRLLPQYKGLAPSFACLALSLLLAELSCRVIENPVRFSRTLSRRPAYAMALALLLTVTAAGSSEAWRQYGERASRTPEQIRFTRAMRDIPTTIYESDCHLDLRETVAGDCVFGDTNGHTTIVLFGDSHAAQWFPALDELARRQQWRLVSFTKSACPVAVVDTINNQLGRPYTECSQWRENMLARIAALRPALVIIGYYSGYTALDSGIGGNRVIDRQAWQAGLRRTFSRLDDAGIPVAVLRDSPRPGFNVPLCLARQAKAHWIGISCEYVRDKALDPEEYRLTRNAASDFARVSFIDLSDRICAHAQCAPVHDPSGIVQFRDSHHLTTEFVRYLSPELHTALLQVMTADSAATSARTPSVYRFRSADRHPSSGT
jgi:peptidoglycan/LPS O-acetylase OafA/YrhL